MAILYATRLWHCVGNGMKAVLSYLRLTDQHDGMLSLTNLALWVVLVKIALAGEVTIVDAGALFVTLLSYQGKKVINKGSGKGLTEEQLTEMDKRILELSSKVSAQQVAMGIKDLRR